MDNGHGDKVIKYLAWGAPGTVLGHLHLFGILIFTMDSLIHGTYMISDLSLVAPDKRKFDFKWIQLGVSG